ncbi:type II toxin-antitoxin system RelE/ParE family toxin [Sorangium sp. So ce381]|uniref:type II toxin-antitoxin system RelE/ParE family toxin n=1 Tax=Sorangium sp. So ce381 TaxID=3133307 RepID=UPI003F5B282E
MKIVVLDEADAELTAAADWYEQEREGLGEDLLAEADRVLSAIAASPTTWPLVAGSKIVRRFLFTRFPYVAYFVVRDEHVLVLAFGHTSRMPGYWRNRLK